MKFYYCHGNYRLPCAGYSMGMNDRNDPTCVALYTMLAFDALVGAIQSVNQ